jgi:hypothetical protein
LCTIPFSFGFITTSPAMYAFPEHISSMKREAICSSETSVYKNTRYHRLEDQNLHFIHELNVSLYLNVYQVQSLACLLCPFIWIFAFLCESNINDVSEYRELITHRGPRRL